MVRPFLRRVVYSLVLQSVEAFLAALCVLVSLPVLLAPGEFTPGSINALLPYWLVVGWSLSLMVGGMITLTAIMFNSYRGERIGVAILWGISTVYAIALINAWPASGFAMATYLGFSLAMMARYWVLGRLIRMNRLLGKLHQRVAELEDELGR